MSGLQRCVCPPPPGPQCQGAPCHGNAPCHRVSGGFTLIELLMVIAIIGLLAGVIIPAMIQARVRANDTTAIACAKALINAEQTTYNDTGGTFLSYADLDQGVIRDCQPYVEAAGVPVGGLTKDGSFLFTLKHPAGSHQFQASEQGLVRLP